MKAVTEAQYTALRQHMQVRFGVLYVLPFGDGSTLGALLAVLGVAGLFASLTMLLAGVLAGSIAGLSLGPVVFVREGLSPEQRAEVLVHEITHSVQVSTTGLVQYVREYAGSNERRALYESEACCAAAELHHAMTGELPNPVAQVAHGYLLDGEAIAFGVALGEQAALAIEQGIYTQPVAIAAIAFLRGLP